MLIDKRLELADGQVVTASAATTSYIDFDAAGDADNELYLQVIVDTGSDSTDDGETVTFMLETDDEATFTSADVLFPAASIAQTGDGVVAISARLPRGLKQFLRGYFTVGGTDASVDPIVTVFLTTKPQTADFQS